MGAKCCKDMASMDYGSHTTPNPATSTAQEVSLKSAKFLASITQDVTPGVHVGDHIKSTTNVVANDSTPESKLNADALYDTGMAYDRGTKGFPKEPARALELLKAAANLGHHEAQYRVGLYYDRGIVVAEDSKEAAHWYSQAAEGGSASAQFSLGICYSKGIGVPQDDAQALEWLQKAGDQDCDLALSSLGYFYEVGVCCQRDLDKSYEYYSKAAELGNVFACQRLSMFGPRAEA
jgi:TPR repeat protein